MTLVTEAVIFAAQAHDGAARKGSVIPYIVHPMEVVAICATLTDDPQVLAAAALHDVMEDCGIGFDELSRRFGVRVGWFDCVATRYGCEMQGATEVAMTHLDVLGYLDELPVCVAYEFNGERVDNFPVTPKLEQCKPIYVKLPGWKCDTRGIKSFDELPENARHYIEFLEKEVGCPFKLISNGPRRDEIIYR